MVANLAQLYLLLLCSSTIAGYRHGSLRRSSMSSHSKININALDNFENENSDRIESVKAAVSSAFVGVSAFSAYNLLWNHAPLNINLVVEYLKTLLSLSLFGITYRYAVRNDENSNLKQGVVASFALTRILGTVSVDCSDASLMECIVKYGTDFALLSQSTLVFSQYLLSSLCLESFFSRGLIAKKS